MEGGKKGELITSKRAKSTKGSRPQEVAHDLFKGEGVESIAGFETGVAEGFWPEEVSGASGL